jgi:DNA-binding NarL/FixJ family response regulator
MTEHFFISPNDVFSPRWQQAFANVQLCAQLPIAMIEQSSKAMVWLYLNDENDFAQLAKLRAMNIAVVALTAIESASEARRAMETGASGYLHYLAAVPVLKQVEQVVAAGGMWLGIELMRQLVQASARILPKDHAPATDLSSLTARELAVAEQVAAGKSNKEVAKILEITERTVKAHLGSAFEKLQVRDRLHLALVFPKRS